MKRRFRLLFSVFIVFSLLFPAMSASAASIKDLLKKRTIFKTSKKLKNGSVITTVKYSDGTARYTTKYRNGSMKVVERTRSGKYTTRTLPAPKRPSFIAPLIKPTRTTKPWLPSSFARRIIKAKRANIDKLIKSRKFADAEKAANTLAASVKKYRLSSKETRSIQADIYRKQVTVAQERQGKYTNAASTVRRAMSLNRTSSDIGKLIKLQKNIVKQKQKVDLVTKYHKTIGNLYETKLPLLRKKIGYITKLLKQRNVSPKEMKKLQSKLAKYSKKLKVVNDKVAKESKNFSYRMKKYALSGITLTTAQNKVVSAATKVRFAMSRAAYKLQRAVTQNLTKINEKFKYSWGNLSADFKKLAKVQNTILSLKKRIANLVSQKKILSDADKKVLRALRDQLRKSLAEANKLYKEVERAFIEQRKFAKLSPKEQAALSAQFAKAWSKKNQIYKNKPTITTLYRLIAQKLRTKPPVISRPVSTYEKMMISALFGKEAVKAVRPNSRMLGAATKYYDKNGKLICSQNGSLGPKYRWLDANGKPVQQYNSGITKVSSNDPEYRKFKGFSEYKITIYVPGKDGFIVKTLFFGKDGKKRGSKKVTYSDNGTQKTEWLDENGKPLNRLIGLGGWDPRGNVASATATATAPVASDEDVERATVKGVETDVSGSTSNTSNLMNSF